MRASVALSSLILGLAGCSRNQVDLEAELPSEQELWLSSACAIASPDFDTWTRHLHGAVSALHSFQLVDVS